MKVFVVLLVLLSIVFGQQSINEVNFYDMVLKVYHKNFDPGTNVYDVTGMFFRDSDITNQGIIGRYLMWCCAADTAIVGFYIQADKLPFKKENWIRARGVFKKQKTPQGEILVLVCESIQKSSDEQPFVFPPSPVPFSKPKQEIPGI